MNMFQTIVPRRCRDKVENFEKIHALIRIVNLSTRATKEPTVLSWFQPVRDWVCQQVNQFTI